MRGWGAGAVPGHDPCRLGEPSAGGGTTGGAAATTSSFTADICVRAEASRQLRAAFASGCHSRSDELAWKAAGTTFATSSAVHMHATLSAVTPAARIELRYPLRTREAEWAIPDDWPVPQSIPHSLAVNHLASVLRQWASLQDRPLFVAESVAVRWLEASPGVGIDPDVCLLDPPPPDVRSLSSVRLWKAGHTAPPLSLEVVSDNHPYKDYVEVPERYAAFARELVVFDPRLIGPKALGGPYAIQLWARDGGVFERRYAGPGPVFCDTLSAWLLVNDGLPQIADDRAGQQRWLTQEDYQRTEKDRERAEKERERAERERERAERERALIEAERERTRRLDVERRLAALEQRLGTAGED
jgi:hypothetical protein